MSDNAAAAVEEFTRQVREIRQSLHQVVVGQDQAINQLMICALTGSHALLVGVPGPAKSLMVKSIGVSVCLEVRAHLVHAGPDALGYHRL